MNRFIAVRIALAKALAILILIIIPGLINVDVSGQVVINEFSSYTTSDWVEIYNNSDTEQNLYEYILTDGSSLGNKRTLSCNLAARGFYVVDWSRSLNRAGDIIRLTKGDIEVDCVTYGDTSNKLCEGQTEINLGEISLNEVGAREVDGTGSWTISSSETKNQPNDGSTKDEGATCINSDSDGGDPPQPASADEKTESLYRMNEVRDKDDPQSEKPLFQVKVYVDGFYTRSYAPEDFTFCEGCTCDKCDTDVQLGFGTHTFRLEKKGYEDWVKTETIEEGKTYEVDPLMTKIIPTPTPTELKISNSPTPNPQVKAKTTGPALVIDDSEGKEKERENDNNSFVSGIRKKLDQKENENEDGDVDNQGSNKSFPVVAGFMIFGGVLMLGAAAYPFIKKGIKRYNLKGGKQSK